MLRFEYPFDYRVWWPAKADLVWVLTGISREASVDLHVVDWQETPPYPAGPHPCALRVIVRFPHMTLAQRDYVVVWLARALTPNYTVVDSVGDLRIDWSIQHIVEPAAPPMLAAAVLKAVRPRTASDPDLPLA